MARVLIATQPWGVLMEKAGLSRVLSVPSAGKLAAIDTTVYAGATGATTISAPSFVTNSDGELPGYVEAGRYTLTVDGEAREVDATTGIGSFQAFHAYRANELIEQAGALYRATIAFTSGAVFNVANWTGISGPAGPTGSPGVTVHDEVLYVPNVATDYSLTCPTDGTGDAGPAVRQAIAVAAAVTTGRKVVMLPPGVLACTPLGRIPKDVLIDCPQGSASPHSTVLQFGSSCHDAGIRGGITALDFEAPTYPSTRVLRGVRITGVSSASIPQTATPPEEYGTGVRIQAGTMVQDVSIDGFCYGLDWRANHNFLRDCTLGGWAGLFFGPRGLSQADGNIYNLTLGGRWAGVVCSHSYYMGAIGWFGGHIAGVPYAFWKQAWTRRDANYSTGTVSTTAGSRTVTGGGTAWLANVKRGSMLVVGGGYYPIHTVDSNTQITLLSAAASTLAGSAYVINEGAASAADTLFLSGNKFYDVAFETCVNGIMVTEDRGIIEGNLFIGCDSSDNATGGASAIAAVVCDGYKRNQHRNSSWWSGWDQAAITTRNADFNTILHNDFGEIGVDVDALAAAGRPFAIGDTGAMNAQGNTCKLYGSDGIILSVINQGSAAAPTSPFAPGDLAQAAVWASTGYEVAPYRTALKVPRGVARTVAVDEQAVVLQVDGWCKVNVAQSVVVKNAAAIGATTLTVVGTNVLGPTSTAVTLVNSAGTTVATGTVASATTITTTALAAAIAKGTQLWIQRTAPVVSGADVVKARFGAGPGGTAQADRGQVLGGALFDTDAPIIGERLDQGAGDNGRQVSVRLHGLR